KIIVQTTIRSPWTQGQSEFWRVRARERPGGRNRGLSRFALLLLVKKDVTVVTKVQLHRRESHLPEELQVGGHYDPGTEANHGRKGRLAHQVIRHEANCDLALTVRLLVNRGGNRSFLEVRSHFREQVGRD